MTARSVLALIVLLAPLAQAGVAFHKGDLASALVEAKKTGKIVMADVYATWCGPCHELDRTIFADDEVAGALAPKILAVKIDGEKEPGGPKVMEQYHVVGFPTVLFIGADGAEIDRIFDVPDAREFVRIALGYVEGKGTLADREREWGAKPSPELAYELGFRHSVKGNELEAKSYFALLAMYLAGAGNPQAAQETAHWIVVAGRAAKGKGPIVKLDVNFQASPKTAEVARARMPQAFLDLGKWLYLRGIKDYGAAERALREVIDRYPGSKEADAAQFQLAYAYHGQKDEKRTREQLEAYLASKKSSPGAANAYAWFCFKKNVFLPDGIRVAETALKAAPKEAGLWDTLAELYGVTGRVKDAIAAEDKAIEHDPKEPYYREQRAKFLAQAGSAKAK